MEHFSVSNSSEIKTLIFCPKGEIFKEGSEG
jgi:hypothetical protein